jgi:hypothetical protein
MFGTHVEACRKLYPAIFEYCSVLGVGLRSKQRRVNLLYHKKELICDNVYVTMQAQQLNVRLGGPEP